MQAVTFLGDPWLEVEPDPIWTKESRNTR